MVTNMPIQVCTSFLASKIREGPEAQPDAGWGHRILAELQQVNIRPSPPLAHPWSVQFPAPILLQKGPATNLPAPAGDVLCWFAPSAASHSCWWP